jgi:TPP-dependent pyruvate/acetoin dehydrogenase alpha subunit
MSYVPKDMITEWEARDPIMRFEARLREMGMLNDAQQEELIERVEKDIDAAQAFAENAPLPNPEKLTEGIFAL